MCLYAHDKLAVVIKLSTLQCTFTSPLLSVDPLAVHALTRALTLLWKAVNHVPVYFGEKGF